MGRGSRQVRFDKSLVSSIRESNKGAQKQTSDKDHRCSQIFQRLFPEYEVRGKIPSGEHIVKFLGKNSRNNRRLKNLKTRDCPDTPDFRCYWCSKDFKQNKNQERTGVAAPLRLAEEGGASVEDNQVISCLDCVGKRFLTGLSETSDWLDYCESNFSFSRRDEVEERMRSPRTLSSWYVYIENLHKSISWDEQTTLSNERRLMEASRIPVEERTKDFSSYLRRKIIYTFFQESEKINCAWCQKELGKGSITIYHLVTRAAGGSHWIGNLVPSCGPCNSQRQDLPAEYFIEKSRNPNKELILSKLDAQKNDPRKYQRFWNDSENNRLFQIFLRNPEVDIPKKSRSIYLIQRSPGEVRSYLESVAAI